MGEASPKSKIKGNGLKADICLIVYFPNAWNHAIVKLLKLESLSYWGQQKERIPDSIPDKRLVNQFIGNDVRISH